MREFQRTHPWLAFRVDLRRASHVMWMLLGEARSKCEHIAGVPLEPETAKRLHRIFLAKGALATTAIEGNTLSESEVLQHLDRKLRLPPSKRYLAKEIDNVVEATNAVWKDLANNTEVHHLTPERIQEYNRLILNDLNLAEEVRPGHFRNYSVGVGTYRGAPHQDLDYLVASLCDWLNGKDFDPDPRIGAIPFAIIKAVLAHLYLAWIHPFGDGNGRTARLVEFHVLVGGGVPTPAAHLLSNHYNQTRTEYYRQLEHASRSGGDVFPFLEYAIRGFVDQLQEQLEEIRTQQWSVAWRDYVHKSLPDSASPSNVRRRRLILDMSFESHAKSDLPFVSPRVAQSYADKTSKTLTRDLNALTEMGLLVRLPDGRYRANRETILAFLPGRIPQTNRRATPKR